jgi:SpoVK/Ycf46/Vps4 family AAA+-type ATPase
MAYTKFEETFANLVNAGFPYLYIPTYEEERVVSAIESTLNDPELVKAKRKLYTWTQISGLVSGGERVKDTVQPVAAADHIGRSNEDAVYILKDFHIYFGAERNSRPDHAVIRKLRDILPGLKSSRKTVVFVSPQLVIPAEMEKEISVLDFALPGIDEIEATLDELTAGLNPEAVRLSPDEKRTLVRAALGLTLQEAENAFCRAIVHLKGLDKSAISVIHEEKNQVVKKTGVLEFVRSDIDINDIGGLENLKNWLLKRNGSWLDRAKAYNIPAPKGVLITGVPGCGKSLTAKAMSAIWGLPLLKLDMGKIFGGIVGSSEENIRKAISTAEAVAPSILWVDEIEKGFAGTKSDGDSGTSARVFGTFLTWMQDKTAPVFVIATSNDISSLPPELLRKGRFDEIFFVDLPTQQEREKIFSVHLKKRLAGSEIHHEIDTASGVAAELAAEAEGFSGAEIEQSVIAALYEAFFADRGLRKDDVLKCIRETVPLSVTQKEQILSLRQWAATRAVLATAREDREASAANGAESAAPAQGGRIVDFDL